MHKLLTAATAFGTFGMILGFVLVTRGNHQLGFGVLAVAGSNIALGLPALWNRPPGRKTCSNLDF